MKEVIIVDKTHLDLGFTDFAENVRRRYLESFIPGAIELAEKVNCGGEKKFVWTTGSWLIKEALEGGGKLRSMTEKALRDGNIAAHALPFTTHTELMHPRLLEYGLSVVDEIDEITGRKTIAAKMTDVPGHTAAIVPALAAHGIKLLHIGLNTAAALPDVPGCFLWKFGGAEVVVIYSDGYGGDFTCPHIDKVLCLDHTADNSGLRSRASVLARFSRLQRKYPGYTVRAGRLDDIAEDLWQVRGKLPIVEGEIGDTWIHGAASDPYKTAALRTLCNLGEKWLGENKLQFESDSCRKFYDALLCVTEHTWGGDMKTFLEDTEHYRKDKFQKARARGKVMPRNIFGDFPYRLRAFCETALGIRKYSYSAIEKSWKEQRAYIEKALSFLPEECRREAEEKLALLRPAALPVAKTDGKYIMGTNVKCGEYTLSVNSLGGANLTLGKTPVLAAGGRPLLRYTSYGKADFDYYARHYMRHRMCWAVSDNLRPGLKEGDCPSASYDYTVTSAFKEDKDGEVKITLYMKCDGYACGKLGAPKNAAAVYTLTEKGLSLDIFWTDKDAVRTVESTACFFYPASEKTLYRKIGVPVNPLSVVSRGNRKISAVSALLLTCGGENFELENAHSPLVAANGANILRFDDKLADINGYGAAFILHDNVWGTNFPLWYEENAAFSFNLRRSGEVAD